MDINIARLDLVSIRLAVLCADTGSLSAAARRANCSVPSASERLKALEYALGKTLFSRNPRGLQLTPVGEVFLRHARILLQHVEHLSHVLSGAEDGPRPANEESRGR